MLNLLRKSTARKREASRLYALLVARAREPVFFRDFGVADSIDGRFDMVTLHAWLALAALKAAGAQGVAQGLMDAIFIGFDEAMREQGAGDAGLSRKMKAFADAFFGRLTVYEAAGDADALALALARNLYRGAEVDGRARALARYALAAGPHLQAALPHALDFGPLPIISAS
jgi:cytochrome b pre-mRNA-processing protein 3